MKNKIPKSIIWKIIILMSRKSFYTEGIDLFGKKHF